MSSSLVGFAAAVLIALIALCGVLPEIEWYLFFDHFRTINKCLNTIKRDVGDNWERV